MGKIREQSWRKEKIKSNKQASIEKISAVVRVQTTVIWTTIVSSFIDIEVLLGYEIICCIVFII